MSDASSSQLQDSIAIVGMSGRFPGAMNVRQFWENLRAGKESIMRYSDEDLLNSGVDPTLLSSANYVKAGAPIDGVDLFDASFFGCSPREAESMDPQQRLFLEHAWESLEDAGCDPARFDGRIGVFAGASPNSYLLLNLHSCQRPKKLNDISIALGNNADFLAMRVAYKFNLRGPAVVVQSSCSTSLVAIHLACQSLLEYQSDMALAGGVSINLPLGTGYEYETNGIYSPDGHCRAFDASAQGTVGGNGVGVVVLKRLVDAFDDGDSIYAIIRGSAINNDGSDKVGFSAPSVSGQADVITAAHAIADVSPDQISYVETHGTGTPLGDPIEIAALTQAFRTKTNKKQYCAIGSLKSNIGHLDAAAGVSSLIKTALALKHATLPASLHFERPNPEINFDESPFYVNSESTPWVPVGRTRIAGVSSFGMGGTNAHLVLEEPKEVAPSVSRHASNLIVLSARVPEALDEARSRLADHLERFPNASLADVAYTLQQGRAEFNHRAVFVCDDSQEAVRHLRSDSSQSRVATDSPQVAFMFPGQGTQYVGMARQLYEQEAVFREAFDCCAALLMQSHEIDLAKIIYPQVNGPDTRSRLNQSEYAQPALFAIEYALTQLWLSWGVAPSALIGHSLGEIVAACIANVFTLEASLNLVAERGKLMQQMPAGAMISVKISASEVEQFLNSGVSLAAINGPRSCTLSGDQRSVVTLQKKLESRGIPFFQLKTSHAFHSEMMNPIAERFSQLVLAAGAAPPEIPLASNLTGAWLTASEAVDPDYWAQHLRGTVKFSEGIALLADAGYQLIEVGPGCVLSTLARQQCGSKVSLVVNSLPRPEDPVSDYRVLLRALGDVWMAGASIDWLQFHGAEKRRRVSLPSYAFQRRKYWIDPATDSSQVAVSDAKSPNVNEWLYFPSWERSVVENRGDRLEQQEIGENWLVFVDDQDLENVLLESLGQVVGEVMLVGRGTQFRQIDNAKYTIDPANPTHYSLLLDSLAQHGRSPKRIIHAWLLHQKSLERSTSLYDSEAAASGFYSLIFLAQAIERFKSPTALDISLVTTEVYEVHGDECLLPERALAAGICKVINQEYATIACRHIDMTFAGARPSQSDVHLLVAELFAADVAPVVALRGIHRWLPTYRQLSTNRVTDRPSRIRQQGVYLILGGLGSIGLEIAEFLAKSTKAKLVLVSRQDFPLEKEWGTLLEKCGHESLQGRRIRKLQQVKSHGGELVTVSADVTDLQQLQSAFSEGERRFKHIDGIFFAAGAAKDTATIQQLDREFCEQQLMPKVKGMIALEHLLRDKSLDFCMVQSSLSSVLGAIGFGPYTAVHHFVDGFVARQRKASKTPWIGVNWDNWLSWKEPEMILSTQESEFYMTPDEAEKTLSRVLEDREQKQIVVSTGDLEKRIARWLQPQTNNGLEFQSAKRCEYERPNTLSDFVEPSNEIEDRIAGIWREVLGIESVGVNDNFFELGGDSILGIQIVSKANAEGYRVTPGQIFECPTVAELAAVAKPIQEENSEAGRITGLIPITPIQQWFFEHHSESPNRFNLPVLIELENNATHSTVEQAINALVEHHDILRVRFAHGPHGIRQEISIAQELVPLESVDISPMGEEEQQAAISEVAERHQGALNIFNGPLMKVVRFDRGPERKPLLVWVMHHLLIDIVSWRIISEDLQAAILSIKAGEKLALPAKTTSFKSWAERLEKHAGSQELCAQADYWLQGANRLASDLPYDHQKGRNDEQSAKTRSLRLNPEDSHSLLHGSSRANPSQTHDILLTALADTLARWSGNQHLAIDIEMHGREDIFADVSLARTVGWFTAMVPMYLDFTSTRDLASRFAAVRDQVQSLPNRGLGFGLLRYMCPDEELVEKIKSLPRSEVVFLYTGNAPKMKPSDDAIRVLDHDLGFAADPDSTRSHQLQVLCSFREGILHTDLVYSGNVFLDKTIDNLGKDFVQAIGKLLRECHEATGQYTPTDFPAARLSQKNLDSLVNSLKKPKSPNRDS